jgi:chromosomal replication initiation ATPase DnaA
MGTLSPKIGHFSHIKHMISKSWLGPTTNRERVGLVRPRTERVLREANAKDVKRKARIPLLELIGKVKTFLGMQGEDLLTGRRKREVSSARVLVSYLAVQEMGYRFTEVGQALNIHPVNIARSLEKGEKRRESV